MKGFRNPIICDLVIQDVYRKYTLVGVYAGDIVVSGFPVSLRIAFYTEYALAAGDPSGLALEFKLDRKTLAKARVQPTDTALKGWAVFSVPVIEFSVPSQAQLRIIATPQGQKPGVLLKRWIVQGDVSPSIGGGPPRVQSQSAVPPSATSP